MHRIWQSPQGLPPAAIRTILHASDGYIWLGTDIGVLRFDGIRFTPLNEIGEVEVRHIVEDASKNVWIATSSAGLFEYSDGRKVKHFSHVCGMPSDNLSRVAVGTHGDIYAASDRGLIRIAANRVSTVGLGSVSAVAVDRSGNVWAGVQQSLLESKDGTRFSERSFKSLPPSASIRALHSSPDGSLWVGTSDGLLRLREGERLFTREDGLASSSILTLAESQDGSVWAGTNEGFSRVRGNEIESFGVKEGLSQSTVYAIAEDRESSLWVGTKRGLNQFLDRRTVPLTNSEGLPSNDVGPVFQDVQGALWVGTLGSGLALKSGKRFQVRTKDDGLSSNDVLSLAGDPSGALFVGTGSGLDLLQDGVLKPRLASITAPVRSLFRDREGSLWIGTSRGLAVLRDGKLLRPHHELRYPVVSIAEDDARHIYAATEQNGIKVFDENSLEQSGAGDISIPGADTLLAENSSIWVGSIGNGLFLIRGGSVSHFSMRDGLFDDDIYGIAADTGGRLWMACSKGIFSVNRSDLLKFSSGLIKTFSSTPFSPLDGLQTVECRSGVQPSAWRLNDGRLAFSTIRGLLIMDPNHMEFKSTPARVAVEAVLVDGRALVPADIRELPPADRNLEFRYTGLSYKAPGRISFRYMLEGFNHDWIDAGARREAYYTNLPPGSYRFRVKACNFDNGCDSADTEVAFTLAARIWQRPWFFPLCAALIAFAAWLGYRLRVQGLKKQFDLVLSERNRIARELHDTLLQGFSGVTMQMQALSGRIPADQKSTMHEIIHDAANCLKEARRSVADLRSQQRSGLAAEIVKTAQQTQGLDRGRLKLRLEQIPATLPPHVEYNLVKIAQEALTNAAKHSGARWIEVVLRPSRGAIRLSIQDDGNGLSMSSGGEGHYGLIGMRERAQGIGADFQLSSVPGVGTTVSVALPIPSRAGEADGVE